MKRISTIAVGFIFTAIFAVSAFAQAGAQPTVTKIGWIDTGAFADPKDGVTKYNAALNALDKEMAPTVASLTAMQTKLQIVADEIEKFNKAGTSAVPVNQSAILAKQEEGQNLQRDLEFEKKKYDAKVQKRSGEVLGPVSNDISKAIQDYAKLKGFAVILDIAALSNANALLALDASANITKEFIAYYNTRPATTATTTAPKQ